jgi:hypothetical protein
MYNVYILHATRPRAPLGWVTKVRFPLESGANAISRPPGSTCRSSRSAPS